MGLGISLEDCCAAHRRPTGTSPRRKFWAARHVVACDLKFECGSQNARGLLEEQRSEKQVESCALESHYGDFA